MVRNVIWIAWFAGAMLSFVLFSLPAGAGRDPALEEEIGILAGKTLALRSVAAEPGTVPQVERVSSDFLQQASASDSRQVPPEILAARGRAWADIGLGDPGLPARILHMLDDDLAGWAWTGEGDRLLVSEDLLSAADFVSENPDDPTLAILSVTGIHPDEPALVHALMHWIQARWVRAWKRPAGEPVPTTDSLLAARAVKEGEANLAAVLFLFQGLGLKPNILSMGYTPDQALDGALMPAAWGGATGLEKQILSFVYMDGFQVVTDPYLAQGWEDMDRTLLRMRRTGDLLHPRRPPRRKPVPPPPELPLPEGYRLAAQDSLGELGVRLVISELTGKDNLGLQAGDGWSSDGLYRFEPAGSPEDPVRSGVTVWLTRWNSTEGAERFASYYLRGLRDTYGGPGEGEGEGRVSLPGHRVLTLLRDGAGVRIQVSPAGLAGLDPGPRKER